MVIRFPAKKNAGCPKTPPRKNGILHHLSGGTGTPLPLPQGLYGLAYVRTYVQVYADVTTKISRIDWLPNLLTNGAPLAGFARGLRYIFNTTAYTWVG